MNFAKYAERVVMLLARRFAGQHHVSISNRPDPADSEYSLVGACQRGRGSAWREPSGGDFCLVFGHRQESSARTRQRDVHLHPAHSPNGLAVRIIVERDDQVSVLTGPDLMKDGKPPKGWTLERDPFLLEEQRSQHLCCRQICATVR